MTRLPGETWPGGLEAKVLRVGTEAEGAGPSLGFYHEWSRRRRRSSPSCLLRVPEVPSLAGGGFTGRRSGRVVSGCYFYDPERRRFLRRIE